MREKLNKEECFGHFNISSR